MSSWLNRPKHPALLSCFLNKSWGIFAMNAALIFVFALNEHMHIICKNDSEMDVVESL